MLGFSDAKFGQHIGSYGLSAFTDASFDEIYPYCDQGAADVFR